MDAPLWELIVRGITASVALFAFGAVYTLWKRQIEEINPVRHLTAFMTGVLFLTMIYRFYVLWVGTQHDHDGNYALNIEPVIRAVGASLLALILLGAGLVAVYTLKHGYHYPPRKG